MILEKKIEFDEDVEIFLSADIDDNTVLLSIIQPEEISFSLSLGYEESIKLRNDLTRLIEQIKVENFNKR